MLTKSRKLASVQTVSGPHLHFETFVASKLKLYFSKLLQWTVHVGSTAPNASNVGNFCQETRNFAYAANRANGNFGGLSPISSQRAVETLGADMRMTLSTFDEKEALTGPLLGRHSSTTSFPWGALVPFDSRNQPNGGLLSIQPALASFCSQNDGEVSKLSGADNAKEMCAWVDVCSGQGANRSADPSHPKVDNAVPMLSFNNIANDVTGLSGQSRFRMCFAFIGNLFSRAGNFVTSGGGSSTGTTALDNPAVLGLAVATATFVNNNSGAEITCDAAKYEMYRGLKVSVDVFTAVNSDKKVNSKKQLYFKSRQQFMSEKLGVSIPNCNDATRANSIVNGSGEPICIGDPTFHYVCNTSCGRPDPY